MRWAETVLAVLPFPHPSRLYTALMKTDLIQSLALWQSPLDVPSGGRGDPRAVWGIFLGNYYIIFFWLFLFFALPHASQLRPKLLLIPVFCSCLLSLLLSTTSLI